MTTQDDIRRKNAEWRKQQRRLRKAANDSTRPVFTCPSCGSTDTQSIGGKVIKLRAGGHKILDSRTCSKCQHTGPRETFIPAHIPDIYDSDFQGQYNRDDQIGFRRAMHQEEES